MVASGNPKVSLLAAFFLLGGCATMTNNERLQAPTIYERTLTVPSGLKVRYAIFPPKSFSPEKSFHLILALHYGGKVTNFYGTEFVTMLIEPALKDVEAIIVDPDCQERRWENPVSERAVMNLLNHISQEYKVDSRRILVTGYSIGGIGTWHLAAQHSDFFTAAIPISALPDPKTMAPVKNVPLYVIHSREDEVFPFKELKSFIDGQKSGGASIKIVVVDGITHYEAYCFIEPPKAAILWIKKVWRE